MFPHSKLLKLERKSTQLHLGCRRLKAIGVVGVFMRRDLWSLFCYCKTKITRNQTKKPHFPPKFSVCKRITDSTR